MIVTHFSDMFLVSTYVLIPKNLFEGIDFTGIVLIVLVFDTIENYVNLF